MIIISPEHNQKKFYLNEIVHIKKYCGFSFLIDFNSFSLLADRMEDHIECRNDGRIKMQNFYIFHPGQQLIETLKYHFDFEGKKLDIDLYASLTKKGITTNHRDNESVILIPTHGKTIYNIYEEDLNCFESYIVEPGDLLIIPKGIQHSAIPLSPRIVISIGVR